MPAPDLLEFVQNAINFDDSSDKVSGKSGIPNF